MKPEPTLTRQMLEVGLNHFRPHGDGGMWLLMEEATANGVATITLDEFPSAFRSYVLFCEIRTSRAAETDTLLMRFNADVGNNYDYAWGTERGDGARTGGGARAATSMLIANVEGNTARANVRSPCTIWVPHPEDTTYEKEASPAISFRKGNLSADTDLLITTASGAWRSTAAITSITLFPSIGPNFVDSLFKLYGVV